MLVIDGYAPTVHLLASDLGIPVALASLHATGFGAGLIVSSLVSSLIVGRIGRSAAIALGLVGLSVGVAVYLASPALPGTLAGIMLAGFFVTIVQSSCYADLALQYPGEKARILSEASAFSQGAGVLAPLIIGMATGTAFGWRAGFAVAILAALTCSLVELIGQRRRRRPFFDVERHGHGHRRGRLPMRFWVMWVSMVTALGIEFAMTLWTPSWLVARLGLPESAATVTLSAILLGIMVGRILAARLSAVLSADAMLAAAALICVVGFGGFWFSRWLPLSIALLFAIGVGIAGHYPLSLSKLIEGAEGLTDRATAMGSLATGTAVALGPLLLGGLERAFGLQWAILLVPALAVVSISLLAAYRRLSGPRAPHSPHSA